MKTFEEWKCEHLLAENEFCQKAARQEQGKGFRSNIEFLTKNYEIMRFLTDWEVPEN